VHVVAAFPTDAQAFHAVIPGDSALDHPPDNAQAGAVGFTSAGDPSADSPGTQASAVLVVVVRPVGVDRARAPSGTAAPAMHVGHRVQQRFKLGDVVAVAAGQHNRERDSAAVGQDVVFGARSGAVDRARTAFGPRRAALTCEESTTARSQSSASAHCSSDKRISCSRVHTPALFQS
jgi:hypothetical protein